MGVWQYLAGAATTLLAVLYVQWRSDKRYERQIDHETNTAKTRARVEEDAANAQRVFDRRREAVADFLAEVRVHGHLFEEEEASGESHTTVFNEPDNESLLVDLLAAQDAIDLWGSTEMRERARNVIELIADPQPGVTKRLAGAIRDFKAASRKALGVGEGAIG